MNNLNYGVIGNCRTAALISQNGNIEWLCFPDFDSPSIFASMLDREKGGAFGFEVSGDYRITQNYVPHTNILSTQFSSDEGEFVVLDYMPLLSFTRRNRALFTCRIIPLHTLDKRETAFQDQLSSGPELCAGTSDP